MSFVGPFAATSRRADSAAPLLPRLLPIGQPRAQPTTSDEEDTIEHSREVNRTPSALLVAPTFEPMPARPAVRCGHGDRHARRGQQDLRQRVPGDLRPEPRHRRQRVPRARRTVRLREVDRSAHGGGSGDDHQRRAADRRPRRQRCRAEGPGHRHGLPELCAVPPHDGVRQHRLRPQAGPGSQAGDRQPGAQGGGDPRARAVPLPQARAALGRPAPAGGDGPGDRAPAGRRSSWTSRCPTSTRSCASRCGPRSPVSNASSP